MRRSPAANWACHPWRKPVPRLQLPTGWDASLPHIGGALRAGKELGRMVARGVSEIIFDL